MLNESGFVKYNNRISVWWNNLPVSRKYGLIFAGFLIFFLLLLLPIPLSGSILGSVDTLFGPALSDTFLNRIRSALFGEFVGQSMYPADIAHYGETGVGIASIFILFRVMGFNDIYSLYITQALLFSLMAFSMVLFARHFTQRLSSAIFAALAFSTSNFIWANVDDLPIHFYFLPLLSAHFLMKAIEHRTSRDLLIAGVVGGMQAYFSVQVYIYQTMILAIILLFSLREWWHPFPLKEKILFSVVYGLIPLPLILFYLNTVINLGVVDVWPASTQAACYFLELPKLLSALPDKLISYKFEHALIVSASYSRFCGVRELAFLGLGIPVLALVGLKRPNKFTFVLILIGLVGFLFSLGGLVKIGGWQVVSPVYFFYEYFPLAKYLRVGLRGYTLFVLALTILASIGLESIQDYLGKYSIKLLPAAALIFSLLFILGENVSWPLNRYEIIAYPAIPDGYVDFFNDKPEALILDLPSLSTFWPGYIDEVKYVIWQTEHKRNILGGVSGYYPTSRVEIQHYTDLLPSKETFLYFKRIGVTHFVWHDSPYLVSHSPGSFITIDQLNGMGLTEKGRDFSWLKDSSYLKLVFKNDLITIYELRK